MNDPDCQCWYVIKRADGTLRISTYDPMDSDGTELMSVCITKAGAERQLKQIQRRADRNEKLKSIAKAFGIVAISIVIIFFVQKLIS